MNLIRSLLTTTEESYHTNRALYGRSGHQEGRRLRISRHQNELTLISQAYVLAQQHRNSMLCGRIRCIFFLATPHRGSDYAALLHGILKYTGLTGLTSTREYVKDLTTGSTSAYLINNDFARYVDDLTIYSFCETLPTISGSSGLIVDKASSILG